MPRLRVMIMTILGPFHLHPIGIPGCRCESPINRTRRSKVPGYGAFERSVCHVRDGCRHVASRQAGWGLNNGYVTPPFLTVKTEGKFVFDKQILPVSMQRSNNAAQM